MDNTGMEKQQFHHHKSPNLPNNLDINKIVLSKNVSFSKRF